MEYIIYCDESINKGKYFSDFYGGAFIRSTDLIPVTSSLNAKKQELNFKGEIKWTKVSSNYLEKYKTIITHLFRFIKEDKIKLRIMFRQTAEVPLNLTKEHYEDGYQLLYYQFLKHAFGLEHSGIGSEIKMRLYFDRLPLNKIKKEAFLNNIFALQSLQKFTHAKIKIRRSDITEINSHDHVLLQCMDIVLGAMAFRLNDLHKEKPEGSRFRGKKTIAKEKLYKHILSCIREIYPNFNIGITTSRMPRERIWNLSYRHWKFRPKEFKVDESKYK